MRALHLRVEYDLLNAISTIIYRRCDEIHEVIERSTETDRDRQTHEERKREGKRMEDNE